MAAGAVTHHPLSGPVGYPFAMGAAQPVAFLAEMTFTAEFIAVVEIDFLALGIGQKIAIFGMMAFDANQRGAGPAMVQFYIAMGKERPILNQHRLLPMADAASIAFDELLTGQNSEAAALV